MYANFTSLLPDSAVIVRQLATLNDRQSVNEVTEKLSVDQIIILMVECYTNSGFLLLKRTFDLL